MGEAFGEITASGSLTAALPIAILAGLVSFFSPCVLPLLPGYLSYATGLSAADIVTAQGRPRRWRMLLGSSLFVFGFSFVFILLGFFSGALGDWLINYRSQINVVMGVVVVVLGLAFAGWLPFFQRDVRVHAVPAVGLGAAPLLGMLFGLGWMPCIGPTLTVILNLGMYEGTAPRGALLAAFYCIGLGVPFVIAALAYHRMLGTFAFFRRHQVTMMRIAGATMVVIGFALVTGLWDTFVTGLQTALYFETSV